MNRNERHARLLLPSDPPLPATIGGRLPSIPLLWERTKHLFARVIEHIGSTAEYSKRWRITRAQKKDLLGWLEPVEKLARGCLLVRALSFLLMTPQGQKLQRETPRMAMPEPQPARKSNPNSTKIPMPGWLTIAQNQRALAERRKLEEQKAAATRAAIDQHDPAGWGGGFRIVGWSLPEPEDGKRAVPLAFQKPRRRWIEILEPHPWPAPVTTKPAREKDPAGLVLARRVEALARVIADPDPAVMRLARFLARLPREALQPLTETTAVPPPYWTHGWEDPRSAAAHVRRAAEVLRFDSS